MAAVSGADPATARSVGEDPPASRMAIAVLALVGILLSAYLALYNVGLLGTIQCTAGGGCLTVQTSAYAWFPPKTLTDHGVPVSVMGLGAYVVLFVLAMLGVQPGRTRSRAIAQGIFAIALLGLLFSAYLTALEAWVIHAWCAWCVVSAVLISVIFLLSIPGLRAAGRTRA